MGRKNCNARPRYDVVSEGYIPIGPRLDVTNPPQGGSGLKTTGESIVREFRVAGRVARVEIPVSEKPISTFERVVRIFLIFTVGWLFGYLHAWMALR